MPRVHTCPHCDQPLKLIASSEKTTKGGITSTEK